MDTPFISVVIPTRNRLDLLGDAIEGLCRQDYPHDRFEVIVVDDGSNDGTWEWLQTCVASGNSIEMKALKQQHGGPGAARNLGIESAAGEYVAFTDDDCIPNEDWLSNLVAGAIGSPCAALGGRITIREATGVVARYCSHIAFNTNFVRGDRLDSLSTANAMVGISALREVGGFDPRFPFPTAEDSDLSHRLRRAGHKLNACPNAVVSHLNRYTWGGGHRTFYNRGLGHGYICAKQGCLRRSLGFLATSGLKACSNVLMAILSPPILAPVNLARGRLPMPDAFLFPLLDNTKRLAKHSGHIAGTLAYYAQSRRRK